MGNLITVVVDAMGGDNAPHEIIKGAVEAVKEKQNLKVLLVGQKEVVEKELSAYDYPKERIEVIHASEVIETGEPPVAAIKGKKDSSIVVGMKLVRKGEADAFVSAGSSGAILVGGTTIVGRIKGIERAPLAPMIPTKNGASLLIDCGANVDARSSHLVQFARMGSIYMEHVVGVKNPRVGIVNIGVEEEKGNALVKETYPLLKECKDINFIGSIEAREIPSGVADVIVTEAFVELFKTKNKQLQLEYANFTMPNKDLDFKLYPDIYCCGSDEIKSSKELILAGTIPSKENEVMVSDIGRKISA